MNKLKIVTNKKFLHQKSKKIKKFDKKLEQLACDMIEIMKEKDGVGLSAVQIGKLIKMTVVEYNPQKMDKEYINELKAYDSIPLTIIVNPKITFYSKEKYIADEGCLSLPETILPISRSNEIHVLAYDLKGNRIKIRAKNFFARVLQHEIDHLEGILITDRAKK